MAKITLKLWSLSLGQSPGILPGGSLPEYKKKSHSIFTVLMEVHSEAFIFCECIAQLVNLTSRGGSTENSTFLLSFTFVDSVTYTFINVPGRLSVVYI